MNELVMDEKPEILREAVGVFTNANDLQAAIDELLSSGFHRAELSLLAGEDAVNEKLGSSYANAGAVADDPDTVRATYVSPEAIGDAQGGIVGVLALCRCNHRCRRGRDFRRNDRRRHRCGDVSRRSWRRCWLGLGQMARRSPRPLSADANRSWRSPTLGANQGRRGGSACSKHPDETFVPGCSRAHAVIRICGGLVEG